MREVTRREFVFSVAGLSACLAVAPAAQFRARAEIVRVYATVKNKDGTLLTDLGEHDFEIRDRGRRAPTAVFSNQPQPITVAILVDQSGALFDAYNYHVLRAALAAFVDRLGSADRARIGWFRPAEVSLGAGLTDDHNALLHAINEEIRLERVFPGVQAATSVLTTAPRARPLWNAVALAMQSLTPESGRKVVLVFTNGPDSVTLPRLPGLKDIRALIPTDEFMIYGITGFNPRYADGVMAQAIEETQTTLHEMTELTGGGDLTAPFDQRNRQTPLHDSFVPMLAGVAEELRQQYTLGFVPAAHDGKIGRIDVRVLRPGLKVWARRTYIAPT